MKRNESKLDRIVRAIAGIATVGAGFLLGGTLGVVLYVVGGVLLFTAATGFCLLYTLFGISTCRTAGEC